MKLLSVYIRGERLGLHLSFDSGLLGFQIFGFKDFSSKILNPFGYSINFGSDLVLFFQIGFGSILRIQIFAQPSLYV